MRAFLLIVNAAAGSADDEAIAAALQVLREHADVTVARTRDLDDLGAAVAGREHRIPIIAGGDGSLHALVETLDARGELGCDEPPTIGVIPLGTGNDLAGTLGLPDDPAEAARVIATGRPRALDVLRDDSGGLVVNVAHVGVGAEAGEQARPWKDRLGRIGLGVIGYAIGAVSALLTTEGWQLRIAADGRQIADGTRRVLQVVIANGATIGGGAEIAPQSDASDGLIDLTVSYATGPLARLRYGVLMQIGRHVDREDVRHLKAREVTVRARRGRFTVNTDGELSTPIAQRSWTVAPGAYRVLLHGAGTTE